MTTHSRCGECPQEILDLSSFLFLLAAALEMAEHTSKTNNVSEISSRTLRNILFLPPHASGPAFDTPLDLHAMDNLRVVASFCL